MANNIFILNAIKERVARRRYFHLLIKDVFWFVVHESKMVFEHMEAKYLDLANCFERVILETVLTQCQISNSF